MEQIKYDIFISYKRQSLPMADNLYFRLKTRGYSTFLDREEMRRDNFNVQLLNYIENAKDVFVILEEDSLNACRGENWEEDWFCREIAFALEKKKNIIPVLLGGYQMPPEEFFPDKLKELRLKNAPEFSFSYFTAYLDKLIEKGYLLSKPYLQERISDKVSKADVFLCHSKYNNDIVRKLCKLFDKHSITYFDDKQAPDLTEGINCDYILNRMIRGAKVVVYLSSEFANLSGNVKEELRYCMRCHKRLIVLKLDTAPLQDEFRSYFYMGSKIDTTFYNESVEKELVERIKSKLVYK